ncbi:LuxR C-terminal-related transcriptional regulator [Enterobacter bugandensis]|uniref:LuxR C-terminal-related transcriptional regulator n=1 Tax=Enterobacter bugandensis TaxID=881260 RepID=UPI001F28D137|nr:LuxR C-terminal-related transcriptional regulator [Enterobacter bugandensis]
MINVLIKEDDFLYHHSLRSFVEDFFNNECTKKVNFLNGYDVENIARAGIIVYAFSKGEHYTCFPELKCARKCVIIGITEAEEPPSSFLPLCIQQTFFVSRSASLYLLKRVLRQAWSAYSAPVIPVLSKACLSCKHKTLSQRELNIMAGLFKGESVKNIAREMMLTPKTIYAHKYAVMHKFNLSSEHELLELLNRLLEKRCNPNLFRDALDLFH